MTLAFWIMFIPTVVLLVLVAYVTLTLCDRVEALAKRMKAMEDGVACPVCEADDAHFDAKCDEFLEQNRKIMFDAVMAATMARTRNH